MSAWLRNLLVGICVFIVAFLVIFPFWMDDHAFNFDLTITYGNVVQAMATVITGIFVAAIIARATQVDRAEKDTLFKILGGMLPLIEDLDAKKHGGQLTEVNAVMMKLDMIARSVKDLLTTLEYSKEVVQTADLEKDIKELWTLATDTPIVQIEEKANREKNTVIRNGMLQLTQERRDLIGTKIERLRQRVYKAQLSINKA